MVRHIPLPLLVGLLAAVVIIAGLAVWSYRGSRGNRGNHR